MTDTYWSMFFLIIISTVLLSLFFVLGLVFSKKLFLSKRYGKAYLAMFCAMMLFFIILGCHAFVPYCMDLQYPMNGTYLEAEATVVEFTEVRRDSDGNGQIHYSKPKFHLADKNEDIVLHVSDVEVGKTYHIRYYPHTKICEIVHP